MYLSEMRGNDVTRETAKSQAKYTELHIYVSLIYVMFHKYGPLKLLHWRKEGCQRRASLWILRLKRGDLTCVDRL